MEEVVVSFFGLTVGPVLLCTGLRANNAGLILAGAIAITGSVGILLIKLVGWMNR
jgi:hypothetical protein